MGHFLVTTNTTNFSNSHNSTHNRSFINSNNSISNCIIQPMH